MAKPTPPAIVNAIMTDLAQIKRGSRGIIEEIAERWGVTDAVVTHIQQRKKNDIAMLREGIAERNFMLVGSTQERIAEALADDKKMAETPIRDMALTVEKLTNAGVTAIDGHAPVIGKIDFTAIKADRLTLEVYDERMARRKAELALQKVGVIDAQP